MLVGVGGGEIYIGRYTTRMSIVHRCIWMYLYIYFGTSPPLVTLVIPFPFSIPIPTSLKTRFLHLRGGYCYSCCWFCFSLTATTRLQTTDIREFILQQVDLYFIVWCWMYKWVGNILGIFVYRIIQQILFKNLDDFIECHVIIRCFDFFHLKILGLIW